MNTKKNKTEEGKKSKRKQIPINLNLEDPRELKMYEWLANQTTNVSGLLKSIAYEYMERKLEQDKIERQYKMLQVQNGEIKIELVQPQHPEPKKKRRLGAIPGVD